MVVVACAVLHNFIQRSYKHRRDCISDVARDHDSHRERWAKLDEKTGTVPLVADEVPDVTSDILQPLPAETSAGGEHNEWRDALSANMWTQYQQYLDESARELQRELDSLDESAGLKLCTPIWECWDNKLVNRKPKRKRADK